MISCFLFRHVFPTLYQWHQHILQSLAVSESPSSVPRSTATTTTTEGTTATTTVHKFPLPTTTTTACTTIPTIRELTADIQLPRLSKQSNIPAGLSAHPVPTGRCTLHRNTSRIYALFMHLKSRQISNHVVANGKKVHYKFHSLIAGLPAESHKDSMIAQ